MRQIAELKLAKQQEHKKQVQSCFKGRLKRSSFGPLPSDHFDTKEAATMEANMCLTYNGNKAGLGVELTSNV